MSALLAKLGIYTHILWASVVIWVCSVSAGECFGVKRPPSVDWPHFHEREYVVRVETTGHRVGVFKLQVLYHVRHHVRLLL